MGVKKKGPCGLQGPLPSGYGCLNECEKLVLDLDGANRAGVGAGTATNALVRVSGGGNVLDLDDATRAGVGASAATDASISVDNGLRHVEPLS